VAEITSEVLIKRLAEWGVDTVFGLPGDGINGIMEGLRRHSDKVKFVLVHHEEAAAFMATAYAKATGKIGVCDVSLACAEQALLPAVRDADPDTVVLADGFSCRTQIEDAGTGRRAVHLAEVLNAAVHGTRLGKHPERQLSHRSGDRIR
jgi:glyoxylate carboligase